MTFSSQSSASGFSGGEYLGEDTVLRPYPLSVGRKRKCCSLDGDGFTVITACFCVLTAAITVALVIQINYGSPEIQPHGAVATDAEECSQVGVDVMRKGGSGVDVAVAAVLCMTVVHPHAIGPGGSGVMLVHDHKTNRTSVFDFMTAVPATHPLNHPPPSHTGGASIGVPGLLRGLEHAHQKYGRLSWATLFQPSVDIARKGFVVSAHLVDALKKSNISSDDGVTPFDRTFFPKGIMLKEGSIMKREKYADFLATVGKHGADSFYLIHYSREEMEALRAEGSEVHVRDLENYEVFEQPCIHLAVKNMSIFTAPAPFGGPQLLTALQLLQNSKITHITSPSFLYHAFIEAMRRSYADYIKLGYTDEVSPQNLTEMLLLSTSRELIDLTVTPANPQVPRLPEQAASPVSVIDTFDQYVTTVAGLGTLFGSRVMTSHGILFNNHLANLLPSAPSRQPLPLHRYRPFTSYTPVIITDSRQVCGARMVLASGTVGAVVQVMTQLLMRHQSLMDAIEQPRVTVKPGSDLVFVEDLRKGAPLIGTIRNDLNAMNHSLQILHPPYTSVTGVTKTKDTLASWSDARGGGVAHRLEPLHIPHNKTTPA